MIQAIINETESYNVEKQHGKYLINGRLATCQIHKLDDQSFQIIYKDKPYKAFIQKRGTQFEISINHNIYKVNIKDENSLILKQLGITPKNSHKIAQLKAPMPGLIIDILVTKGDKVIPGQPLIVLKAMKMENIIKSSHDGVINEIFVKKDQKIEKDALMLQF